VRQSAKLCDVRDWDDADFVRVVREILPERDPLTHVERKVWEFAMLALFLEDAGRMNESTEALAVGAGDERVVFWLANRLGRVVATDIYGEGAFAGREAKPSMLDDPAAHAPFPYREDRLDVRWMDARRLEFPDASFDVVFSLSSFEHFGGAHDVQAAARELGRVLRPGGHAFVVTECFVRRHPLNAAPVDFAVRVATLGRKRKRATPRQRAVVVEVFTPRELERLIVRPSGLELMQPLDLSLSPESWSNVTRTDSVGLHPASGDYWPHVLLQAGNSIFTSVALPLRKPI
jgi:SAM-dependent methyltransferase